MWIFTSSGNVARLLLMLLTTLVPSTYLVPVSGATLQRNVVDSCPTCSILCEKCAMINFTCCVDPRNGVTNCVNAAHYPVCPEAYCGCDASAAPSVNPSTLPSSSPSADPSSLPSARPSTSPSSIFPIDCDTDGLEVMISITTDNYPRETFWEIIDNGKSVVEKSDEYFERKNSYNTPLCLNQNGCYKFFIGDTYGDGLCCKFGLGSYSVLVDSSLLASGGNFKKNQTTGFFGGCSESGLLTTFDDNNGEGGNMFDVVAFTDVVIGGFHVNVEKGFSKVELEVYTKAGGYEGHEKNASAWTLVMGRKEVIVPAGGGETDLGFLDVPVTISANTSQAFYVTATEHALRYTNIGEGVNAVEENEHMKLSMGCGVMYKFKKIYKGRKWNGIVKYAVANKFEGAPSGAVMASGAPKGSDVEGWDRSDPMQGINPTSALVSTTNVREVEDPVDQRLHSEQGSESKNGVLPPVLSRERRRRHAGNHPYHNDGEH